MCIGNNTPAEENEKVWMSRGVRALVVAVPDQENIPQDSGTEPCEHAFSHGTELRVNGVAKKIKHRPKPFEPFGILAFGCLSGATIA